MDMSVQTPNRGKPANFTVLIFCLTFGGAAACYGQVVVQSVTDAASYGPRVAPGALATIFGQNLASSETEANGFPLPTTLGGTNVVVQGVQAPLYYVNTTQINFQVPSGLKSGQASVVVHATGGTSSSYTITVISEAPAIFQYGNNHAVAQNNDTAHSLNSSTAPAAAGSVITVYLTGQGPVDNPVTDGLATPASPISTATASATATIGPQNAAVQFLGLTPDNVGLAQANIQVPALPNGDYPLVITVGGIVSTSAVISVSGSGIPYTSPLALVGTAVFQNSSVSSVVLLGNTAYVCGATRITMVDVTHPAQPAVIGEFGDNVLNGYGTQCAINSTAGSPYLVDIVGPLYNPVSFATYDLTNPRSPNLVGVTATQYAYIVNLSFSGAVGFSSTSYFTYNLSNHAIVSQNGYFLAFDFTNPGRPQLLSVLQPGSLVGISTLKPAAAVVNPAFAYIASSTATGSSTNGTGMLYVVSIGSPSTLLAVNQVAVSQAAILLTFDISGNTLLVAGNSGGNRNPGSPDFDFTGNLTLTTMNVSNVEAPAILASFNTGVEVSNTLHTAAFSNGVFAIVNGPPNTDDSGPASLMIVDARQPQNPILYPFQTQFGFNGLLATSNGYLLASASLGLYVYQLQLQ